MDPNSITERLANLSPAKRALLEQRLKGKSLEALAGQTIPRRASRESAPLSFAQQRLWFLNQLEPNSPAYNESRAVRLTGVLDVEALEKSLNHIIGRHEALRTTFVLVDGNPMQRIADYRIVELPVVDLRCQPVQDRDAEAHRLIDEAIRVPFDLSRDLMLRVLLLRLEDQQNVLVLVKHHVASDGWSSGILWQEVTALYEAYASGRSPNLRDLPVQYADYSAWQREWLRDEVLETHLSYWRKQLDNLATLQLSMDRPRPAIQSFRGAKQTLILPKDLSEALKALSRKQGVTLFMTLLAAFQTLLYRYTGQQDIAVGSLIAGRNRAEIEGLIGFFVNTLVLRSDVSSTLTFRELLERVRSVCLDAYSHQDLPFEKLVEELQPDRSLNQNPLFQVTFQLNNAPRPLLKFPGIEVEDMELEGGIAKFDLSLSMSDRVEGIAGRMQYNTELFEEGTIARMLGHFQILLNGIVVNPEQRISDLPILTEAEKHQLLVEWNETKTDYPNDKCIHELFETQVEKTPDAIALVFENQRLTYRELNNRANQLAHYLQKFGVGPEVLVGICVERSKEMVVGLLGILKAGGAYVPLDPDYPRERLGFMLDDSQASVLLIQQQVQNRLPAHKVPIVCMNKDRSQIAQQSDWNPIRGVTGQELAYVIYTSGTTGTPKGVMINHRSLVNYLSWFNKSPLAKTMQSLPVLSRPTFDASLKQLFAPLLRGDPVWILSDEVVNQPVALLEALTTRTRVGLNCVPSLWRAVLDNLNSASAAAVAKSLSSLFLGGERLDQHSVDLTFAAMPHIEIWNLYGPTEATANACTGIITPCSAVTIGRPIANTQVYILDGNLQPLPVGVPGELHIGGDGLARGYLNRPELTSEKFIANPFSADPTSHLYKTGDLARYLPDGNIEFLRRIDDQVKIRGYRIELGEIDAVLGQHPAIREAVVLAREDSPGDQRLVAYVVAASGSVPSTNELRRFLQQKVPEYMVPSVFMFLEALPLTPNGKVDRKALPAPERIRPELDETFFAPRTPVEELLAQIWSYVLKLDEVGIHDNFFDLGGHSLLATRLVSRIRDAFSLELPLRGLFEAPTVAGLAEQIGSAREGEARIRALPILREPIDEDYPLSFSQERFWFLSQLDPNNLAYKVTRGFRLSGSLNIEALERALSEIVRRHETLRTTYHLSNDHPVQRILDRCVFKLSIVDLTQNPPLDLDSEVQGLFENEHRSPFDLSTDVLLRATLVRLSTDENVLLVGIHHVAWDHWCIQLFWRELSTLYQAFAGAKPSPLTELPIQYKHYALWQRKMFQGADLESHLAYWKKQLAGAPPFLELPADHPRKPLRNRQGGRQTLVLPKVLDGALRSLSRNASVTFFMTLLASFQTLLHKLTSEDDIVVGTPVAGRDRSETEGLLGLFLNSLALRTNLSGNPTFLELLARVREVALGAYDHQELPFEKLVEALQPDRDLSKTPIFQVFINMYNFKEGGLEIDGLTVEPLKSPAGPTPQFDLEFFIREHDDGAQFAFVYDSDLFESATIARLLAHFQVLLEGIVANPEQRICDLPILTEAERHQLLVEWNETKRAYPKDKCVHQLFEEQVKRTPESIAVVFEDQQLTYGELNRRANQLAHYLKRLGVGPEMLVGICVERSLEMIVGLLGVLKTGGAYVPLDTDYPKERLAFMLEDAKVQVLLTQQGVVGELPQHQARVICLDGDWGEISQESEENLSSEITGENLAYVIYTSGSTGTPKGAMNTHKGLSNRLHWMQDAYQLSVSDRVLQKTPFSFDVSVWEFFWPLITGARLVIARPGGHQDRSYLVELINKQRITTLHFVPSMLRLFLEEERIENCKTLRQVICSGEALPLDLQMRFFERMGAKLHNLYGPTEASIDVTYWECQQRSDRVIVPIGRPIANTQIYILDNFLNPVPIGVQGELHIGGDGLARGYLNRPELTKEKFINNPFSADPTSRLYKSGDRARYSPEGNIEFLGRIDNQVKLRGYRIELGEIEAVLSKHPAIREAVVLAREDSPGERRLVAYVVALPDTSTNELRGFLKQKLPEFMVPAAFVFLDSLPLTPNGKVERRALPAPAQNRPELDETFLAPRTPVEELLVNIWANVLKLDEVGIHDNFFELGGHSLLATQVMARICGALSVELPLRRLFEYPTIYALATAISAERQTPQTRRFPAIAPASRDGDLPLSFAQQRLWFIDQLEPESSAYNVPGAWRLSGPLDLMALQRSVNEIVLRHEVLRTSFVTVDGQPTQHIRLSVTLPLELIHLAELADSERESAIKLHVRAEFQEPFDLARGSLVRAKLLRLAEDDHVLLLTMHHIVSDGWSIGVLFRELSRLYEAFVAGNPSPLEDLPIQYADYTIWQRGWLQGEVLEAQLAYWRRQLENLTVLQLPTDRQRPTVQRYRGAKARVNFNATLTKKLWDLSRGENATLYMTLLAAFQILLSRYSGQEDIAVGSPIAGRSTSEVEGLIGFFANTLVLRGDLSGNPTFREFLRRMRGVALEAYAHQDLPFEKLVEELSPRRDLNISPLFQVMLVMQNNPREDLNLKGLKVSSVSIDSETAKFDLLLSLRENQFGLRGTLEYDTDLFDSSTIDRMLGQFATLLDGIGANPDQRILQLPLLTDAERHQLLAQWNDTKQQYPEHLCLHQLFEKQAEKSPDGAAIIFEDQQMTYRELDIGSNQLAHYLRKHGVGTESLVGVCLERSPEMIVAVLAILKAGGAYLPLDPSYPPERVGLMVEQAGASIILTQKSLVSRIPTGEKVCHCLDSLDQYLAQEEQECLSNASSPENAAYVLFTSGSSGVPKGVLMEHRPLVNLLSWQITSLVCHAGARTLQFAPLSFDVSFQEIFSTLCSGGTLVMIGEAERHDSTALVNLLNEKSVERMFLPFVALQQLAEAVQNGEGVIENLREIITAGEQLRATRPIVDLFVRSPNCRLYNQYGPTESHVVTSFPLASEPVDWPNLPPIGRPIANSKIYILDSFLQPVPIGVCGEIFIGGDSLARGYLNQPQFSAEKFVANPFDNAPGARLYRTGDLARYLADGNIQFVGRIDHQVKVRGFRIEPGEIETLLCRHPEVLECVVSAREDATEGKWLVAYVVAGAADDLNSGELRDFLKEKLPEYMIPNIFVFLKSLPLTPSGKVDRRALPAPDGSRPELAEAYVAPRNVTEKLLAKIWAEVLKLEKIGIHDNFFDLGGHSLVATRVASRIREVFRIELPLRALFETPTVAGLTNHIEPIRCAGDEHQRAIQEDAEQTEETIL